jgi:AP-3 complex subunit beta
MFPQFTNTAASLTRATALIHRVGTDAYLYDDPEDANIASLLDSKFEAEKVQGLKRLIALLSQGVDVSNFFPQVCLSVCLSISPEFLLVHSFKRFSGSECSLS